MWSGLYYSLSVVKLNFKFELFKTRKNFIEIKKSCKNLFFLSLQDVIDSKYVITLVLCGVWVGFSKSRHSWHFQELLLLLSPIL